MTSAKLILLTPQGKTEASQVFNLTDDRIKLGRSPDCPIRFDSNVYGGVSRHHATLLQRPADERGNIQWQLCDENSANGTYVNGQSIQGCVTLSAGDKIQLSQNGPILTYQLDAPQPPPEPLPNRPLPVRPPIASQPSFSQLIPVVASSRNFSTFFSKGYILPGILTVTWVVLLFFTRGNLGLFIVGLGIYLGAIGYSFIYRLCGKPKPWWEISISILLTMLLLMIPGFLGPYLFIFRTILPGDVFNADPNFVSLFIAHFFGAGLSEELLKAIPVFLLMFLGNRIVSTSKHRFIGVKEPLDGIVLAAASGLGFTFIETLVQYVPNEIIRVANELGGSADAVQTGQLLGIQLLVPRIIGSLAGHMAYSGYFGYFIGLSALYTQRRWLILGVGYFTSSLLHALWNASGGTLGPIMLAIAGIMSYVFLIAAILKARELSPTRAQNFATRIVPPPNSQR